MMKPNLALLLFLVVTPSVAMAVEPLWHSGSARIKLTPKQFMWMSGYGGRTVPADGQLTDLWAKAVVLRDPAGKEVVLISADLVGIGAASTDWIVGELQRKHGLSRDQIAIATSHTHTGPALSDNLVPLHFLRADQAEQNRMIQYTLEMRQALVDVVGMAYDDIQPVHLTWGSGLCTFAVNRRNNTESDVSESRLRGTLQGPFDHDVPVLAIRNEALGLEAVVFGYACHATVLSLTKWSGDYPGYAQQQIEKMYPGAQAIFWAGCGADQNPLPRREVQLAEHYGLRLAQSVDSVIRGTMTKVGGGLKSQITVIDGKTQVPVTREKLNELLKTGNQYEKPFAQYLLGQLGDSESLPSAYPYPIQTWHIGDDVSFVFLGGEVVVDYALELKRRHVIGTGNDVWIAGYSNDVMAYIPSARVLKEGGYEGGGSNVYYGFPALWSESLEEQILTEVDRQLSAP